MKNTIAVSKTDNQKSTYSISSLAQVNDNDVVLTVLDDNLILTDPTTNTLSVKNYPFTLSLRRTDFDSEKSMVSFIKNVERIVRISEEYKLWLNYLRETLGYKTCAVTDENIEEVTVEVHHHPINLYLIVKSIVLDYCAKNRGFTTFDIANEVLKLHYDMKIGFVLLVKTLHEKFHNGAFKIPMELVSGDYSSFIEEYKQYFDEDEMKIITDYLSVNKSNCGWTLCWPK